MNKQSLFFFFLVGVLFLLFWSGISWQGITVRAFAQEELKEQKKVNMDFDRVDLGVFIKFISNLTGKNFLVDDKVRGKVTIISPKPLTVDEAYKVFQSVLEVNGFTTVPSGDVVKIVRTVESRQKNVPLRTDSGAKIQGEDEIITQLIPLEHADSSKLRKILVPMVTKQGLLVAYSPTETIILIDYSSNVKRLKHIIAALDKETFTGKISLFSLENGSADEMVQKLNKLLASGRKGRKQLQQSKLAIVPDERTNSILVLAGREQMAEIKTIVEKLDQPASKNLSNIRVIPLENAQAEDLAKVLSTMPGRKTERKEEAVISRGVSIVADQPSNSLVITAEPKEFQTLLPIIQSLDQPRKQVFVEAAIVEISLDTTIGSGIKWQGGGKLGSEGVALGTSNGPVGTTPKEIAGNFSNTGLNLGFFSFPFTFNNQKYFSLSSFINVSQTDNRVKIISTPQLMTMENEEAKVVIAENRPYLTSREETESGNNFSNFEYKDVGVTLKVTPMINNQGWIKMAIYQEVSRADLAALATQGLSATTPITRKRTAETTVSVKDGQTVVLAGLMEKKNSKTKSQIPLLGDVPILGHLFKNTDDTNEKTNLMVFITPHIVKTPDDARALTYNKSKILNKIRFGDEGRVQALADEFSIYSPMP